MCSVREVWSTLVLCSLLHLSINGQTCDNGKSYYKPTIICKNISVKFPPNVKPIYGLTCIDCNIPTVDETIITNFRGEVFNLSNSHVKTIAVNAFRNFDSNIHEFIFENNEISSIAPVVFSNFSVIDNIILRNNNLTQLVDKVFYNTSTYNLDLSKNHLYNITFLFMGLKVNGLNLSKNEILDIGENTFENTTFWQGRQWRTRQQFLDLSSNLIQRITPNTFKSTSRETSLRFLYLNNNKLTCIENNIFSNLSLLIFLSLENNYVSNLYNNSFKGLTRLETLILRKNVIEKIPPSLFADLQSLETLDLSKNRLTTLSTNTFTGLYQLTKLNISHNNLKVLEDSHIFPLGRLMTLDISDTRLRTLNLRPILEHHYKLRVLVINDNFWKCKQLVRMYRQMNERIGGFDYPTHRYNVPNLHGIACSRTEIDIKDDMSFDDFLNVIAQDNIFEDIFDPQSQNYSEVDIADVSKLFDSVRGIFFMIIMITIIIVVIFANLVIKSVLNYLYTRNIVQDKKISFAYSQNQDNVELIN